MAPDRRPRLESPRMRGKGIGAAASGAMRVGLAAAGTAATFIPRRLEAGLGAALGRAALRAGLRRGLAEGNIARCLPDMPAPEREALLERHYEAQGRAWLERAHLFSPLPGHYGRYARAAARLEGLERWAAAHARGRGVILVSARLVNTELMAAAGGLAGLPLTMVARPARPEWLQRRIVRGRRQAGFDTLASPRGALRLLRRGETVGFVLEQYAAPPACALSAIGELVARAGSAVVPVRQSREDGVVRATLEPELDLGPARGDAAAVAGILTALMRGWVREEPSQWLWAQRRLKPASGLPFPPPAPRAA